ncbi:5' exonuclease Apollo [Holothuria leucospilota]|uniref:5' exonuclease Apollo n=1 Tax=Holothuria leucospilota TaxID=206669 RepID=A0A9Q1HJK9_HOLLE|nr:5' exonuclease Apollo [Holothuria leucospilota]
MNGCIITDTPIAVDFWRLTTDSPYYVHFLSHMHSDHTRGLSSAWRRPLYCSEVTSRLLKAKFHVKESLIHTLPIGQAIVIPLAHDNEETMTVTLIDANHCPGAVMFLFEGYFGKILYTGDFKYSPSMLSEGGLQNCQNIDVLYLDNTFNSEGCVWPAEHEAAEMIEGVISSSISDTNFLIALHNLGKEELLVRIALKFQRWIVVSPARYETLKLLEMPNVFTTDPEASNISVINQSEVTWKNLIKWNSGGVKTIVIVPSALYKLSKVKTAYNHPNVVLVPYSSHSSYTELVTFVSNLCPKRIVPIVNEGGSSSDVSSFDCFLSKREQLHYKIPECVKTYQRAGIFPRKEMRKVNLQTKARTAKRKVPSGVVYEDLAEVSSKDCARTTDIAIEGNVSPPETERNVNLISVTPEQPRKYKGMGLVTVHRDECSPRDSQEGDYVSTLSAEQKGHLVKNDVLSACNQQEIVFCQNYDSKPLSGTSRHQCRKLKLQYKTPNMKIISIPVKHQISFYQVFENIMAKIRDEHAEK